MNTARNIYRDDVNFSELAIQDHEFAKVVKPNGQLDFSDPNTVQQLTKSLLKRDFNLNLILPPNRLCPPVPNRFNYILWIQSLLDTSSTSYSDHYEPQRDVLILDIGTGASCIYPLLGCAQRPRWRFAATDIDDLSLEYARENVRLNGLEERIKVVKTTAEGLMIPLNAFGLDSIDLLLTNPPFHPSTTSLLDSAALKSRPPNTACTGSTSEMVTPGGEVAFVSRIIDESCILRHRVQWYTTMLGKLSSVPQVVSKIRSAGITNWAVAEFVQGSRTRRWAVGWSFVDRRPKGEGVARAVGGGPGIPKALLPFPAEYTVEFAVGDEGIEAATRETGDMINTILTALPDIHWTWRPTIHTGVGFSARNTWSRAARRRRKQTRNSDLPGGKRVDDEPYDDEMDADEEEEEEEEEEEMAFGFKITAGEMPSQAAADSAEDTEEEEETEEDREERERAKRGMVTIRWVKGIDNALFESFCGMMRRKLEEGFYGDYLGW